MKSIFSQFFKSSLFNHVMRLAIVIVCLSYSAAADAGDYYHSKMTVKLSTNSAVASGKVYVQDDKSNNSPDYKSECADTYTGWNDQSHKYLLYAQPEDGYTFDGWEIVTNTQNIKSSIDNKVELLIPANAYGDISVTAKWNINS